MSKRYNPGKISKLWEFLVHLHQENPDAFQSAGYLKTIVSQKWPQLNQKQLCPSCEADMREYRFTLTFLNALLLKKMGDAVKTRLVQGVPLTEANKVHVVSMDIPDTVRHRTTQTAKLGLIAKVKKDGKHDRELGWAITKRGFAALRGEKIPLWVVSWRNRIIDRSEETTTLAAVFEQYRLSKKEGNDLSGHTQDYIPKDWYEVEGLHNNNLV